MNIKHQSTNDKNHPAKKKKRRTTPKPPKKISPTYLHNSGLYYLERFASSSENFRAVMMRKVKKSCMYHKEQSYEECEAMVAELVDKFRSSGLLDDQLYTRGVVTSLRRSGKSRRAIMMKLKSKGLDSDLINQTLSAHDEDIAGSDARAEFTAALTHARKKRLGPFMRPDRDIPHEKALASMARAGFNYDMCKKVLEMSTEDAEDIIHRHY